MQDALIVRLLRANRKSIDELAGLLGTLPMETYDNDPADEGRVSAHVRHICDFYRAFLDGAARGHIDYDDRQREVRLEDDVSYAIETLQRFSAELADPLHARPGRHRSSRDKPILVTSAVDVHSEACVVQSTLARELSFLHSHTTHHVAIVVLLLRRQGICVDAAAGVAPSTLKHRISASR